MNILEIGYYYDMGGAATVMHQIADGLTNPSDKVYIMGAYNCNNSPVRSKDEILYNKKYINEVETLSYYLDKYKILNLYAIFRIIKFCHVNKIDVIHFHAMQDFIGIQALILLSKLYPVVWTFHDCWGFTGKCLHTFKCEKWKKQGCVGCKVYDKVDTNLLYKMKKMGFTKKKIIFTSPSHWLKKKMSISFLEKERMVVVPNGINVSLFHVYDKASMRRKYNLPDGKKNILFVAAKIESRYKGFPILKSALEKLPPNQYRLLVVGEAKRMPAVIGNVEVKKFGYVSNVKQKNEIMSMADVFVIPSIQENFPCVVLESMASGTPVIGFDVGGIPEQISGGCGWICEDKTGEALADKIYKVLENEKALIVAGDNARAKVEEYYDIKVILEKYRRIYKEKCKR